MAAPAIRRLPIASKSAFSTTRGPREVFISRTVSLINANSAAPISPLAPVLRTLCSCSQVDRSVAGTGGGDQFQFGQAIQQGRRHRRSFSHDANDVER